MPNWCYNSLSIEAVKADPNQITKIISQLNQPFEREHDQWNPATQKMEIQSAIYPNPVFAFWNIVKPTDLEAYIKQSDNSLPIEEQLKFNGDNWYDWNVRNWGTKWDVGVSSDEKYPDTTMEQHGDSAVIYSFNTAWSPPIPAILTLSTQYPDLVFTLFYEEETGWGGNMEIMNGSVISELDYENKCRDCDSLNTLEYCDNDCGEICSACNYMGEADLDAVSECEIHKVYLDKEHVPDYRLDKLEA